MGINDERQFWERMDGFLERMEREGKNYDAINTRVHKAEQEIAVLKQSSDYGLRVQALERWQEGMKVRTGLTASIVSSIVSLAIGIVMLILGHVHF